MLRRPYPPLRAGRPQARLVTQEIAKKAWLVTHALPVTQKKNTVAYPTLLIANTQT
jgi:hypothetical protein